MHFRTWLVFKLLPQKIHAGIQVSLKNCFLEKCIPKLLFLMLYTVKKKKKILYNNLGIHIVIISFTVYLCIIKK